MNLLHDFKNKPFIEALQSFFKNLNVPFNVISEYQTKPENIIGDKKCNQNINAIYPLGIVTDAIFNQEQIRITQTDVANNKYEGILLFGVEVSKTNPTRSDLAEISRQINREFSQTPVVVVFSYADKLTFANAERIDYKQTWREGEKVGKVSMLKDINVEKPHRAHHDILSELGKHKANTFDDLYKYWQEKLNTKALNKKFFKKIANWYFLSVAHSKFPYEYLKKDTKLSTKTNDELQELANQKATIRFITRMIFVWFLKEKKLISDDLFEADKVSKILKNFNQDDSTDYYNAILQNLFFATLNKAKEHREFALKKSFHENKSNHDVNSLYRNENMFQDENPENIMKLFVNIPFLNGGLFDSLDNKENKELIDGFSREEKWQAKMPDFLFFEKGELDFDSELRKIYDTKKEHYEVKGLFEIFNEYKFTIEENTPLETDVALDPYLLGEIFENLLAYYNPETGATARKGTGSFYTPQEIVNYMVDESLKAYLSPLSYEEEINILTNEEKYQIIKKLSDVKILDPACGSGAFPMGVLYKMVDMLKHIDPDNSIWKQIQHDKIIGDKITELEADKKAIAGLCDKQVKEKATKAVEDRLQELETIFNNEYNFDDYARKLYIIQNCIYGVDIQDVAIQISKLRFFLSLIVDQKNDDIKPLPNLETKFVIANTLIGIDLPKLTLMGVEDHSQDTTKKLKEELKIVRYNHFKASTRTEKLKLKAQDKAIREQIANSLADTVTIKNQYEIGELYKQIDKLNKDLIKANQLPEIQEVETGTLFETKKIIINPRKNKIAEINQSIKNCESKIASLQTNTQAEIIRTQALKIAQWDIYNQNAQANWFDMDWMFGIQDGFDVVIGNPPYVNIKQLDIQIKNYIKVYFNYSKGGDIYVAFIEKGLELIKKMGVLNYIIPNKFFGADYGKSIRKFLKDENNIDSIWDLKDEKVFENASISTIVIQISKFKKEFCKLISSHKETIIETKNLFDLNEKIQIESNNEDNLILLKIRNHKLLNEISDIRTGVMGFEYWKMEPIIHNDIQKNTIRIYTNGNLSRYCDNWESSEIKLYKKNYKKPTIELNKDFLNKNTIELFNTKPKIIVRGVSKEVAAIIDFEGSALLVAVHSIIPNNNYHINFIVSILNSKLINWFHLNTFYSVKIPEGSLKYPISFFDSIPIPEISEPAQQPFINLVNQILEGKKSGNDTSHLEHQIDVMIYKLYELTYDEVLIVEPEFEISREEYESYKL